ncbi:MAG: hypothetical protein ACK5HP_04940 [Bacilli bacterium]
MLKKIAIYTITLLSVLFINTNIVKAVVSGDNTTGSGQEGTGCSTSLDGFNACRLSTDKHMLYVGLTNSATKSNATKVLLTNATSAEISKAINDITASKESMCTFLSSTFGINCKDLENNCDSFQDTIYFSITAGFYYKKQLYSDYTVKELAQFCTSGSFNGQEFDCSSLPTSYISNYLRVVESNAGVYSATTGPTSSWSTIASIYSGYGVAAIRLSDYGIGSCTSTPSTGGTSGYKIIVSSNAAKCTNTGTSNYGSFTETTVAVSSGAEDNVTAYGKLVDGNSLGKYCKLYCLESATQIFPGNVSGSVGVGRYLIWPDSAENKLQFSGIRTCRISIDGNQLSNDYSLSLKSLNTADAELKTASNGLTQAEISLTKAITYAKNGGVDTSLSKNVYSDAYNKAKQANDNCNTEKNNAYTNYKNLDATADSICEIHGKGTTKCFDAIVAANVAKTAYGKITCSSSEVNSTKDKLDLYEAYETAKSNRDSAKSNRDSKQTSRDTAYQKSEGILTSFKSCLTRNYGDGSGIYDFKTTTSISYNDPEYGGTFDLTGSTNYSCSGCSGQSDMNTNPYSVSENTLSSYISSVATRIINVYANVTYTLRNGYYYYIDKLTNKSVHSTQSGRTYINLGFSNLPISYNADTSKTYSLIVNNTALGHKGAFSSYLKAYTCSYKVSSDTSSCVCPGGSLNSGMILCENLWSDTTEQTCADAILQYCNDSSSSSIETTTCPPPTTNFKCPVGSNNSGLDLSACLYSGYSKNYCISTFCYDSTLPPKSLGYTCPSTSKNPNMDITNCVLSNAELGASAAYSYCVKNMCDTTKSGINIIYRTISLKNPFPGKNISKEESGFNVDVIGRTPGYNWNSIELVKKVILTNRGVSNDSVYTKTPLYIFTLTSTEIKKIREYNDNQSNGYADFTLECSNSDGSNCLSNTFLRNYTSGLTGGTCMPKSHTNFYKCDD